MTGTRGGSHVDLVRFSRDGDQFHYLWAARRTLSMLRPDADTVAIVIEGVAPEEGEEITAGLDVIDVTEYDGSTDIDTATRVAYVQLKHSTRQVDIPWQVSGLKPTLAKFARRYVELIARLGRYVVAQRIWFVFETNRPIADTVADDLAAIRAGMPEAGETPLAKATGLSGADLRGFVAQVSLNARAADYLAQRRLLGDDVSAYLPDSDKDAPLQLKDLVARKATSEFATNPLITRHDVLHAIGAREPDLYPAPSLIDVPPLVVDREQLPDIVAEIVAHPGSVIVQADGGVGKSVVATRIGDRLPAGSVAIIYDCFGNGSYRSLSGRRHRPSDGFVELANQMAARELCDPLIPTTKADGTAYARAFGARVRQVRIPTMPPPYSDLMPPPHSRMMPPPSEEVS